MCEQQKVLIYEPYFMGHHAEYINNIWTFLKKNPPISMKVYFGIHFKVANMLRSQGIEVEGMNNIEIISIPSIEHSIQSRLSDVKKIVKNYKITNVILLTLNPLFINLAFGFYKFNITGIVFNPYNPNSENYSLFQRVYKEILYSLLSKRKRIKKMFILNNEKSCKYLNNRYKTDKFQYLPDPIPSYPKEDLPDKIKDEVKNKKIILHFGAMSERKGTLLILDSIAMLPKNAMSRLAFFFVGKPYNDTFAKKVNDKIAHLREQFAELYIYYEPNFVSFGQMESYYEISDFVLMPYLSNNMSSGVLGHAVKHNKPVITGKGLLGEIVTEYSLGISINPNIENIVSSIKSMLSKNWVIDGSNYVKTHSTTVFANKLVNSFC